MSEQRKLIIFCWKVSNIGSRRPKPLPTSPVMTHHADLSTPYPYHGKEKFSNQRRQITLQLFDTSPGRKTFRDWHFWNQRRKLWLQVVDPPLGSEISKWWRFESIVDVEYASDIRTDVGNDVVIQIRQSWTRVARPVDRVGSQNVDSQFGSGRVQKIGPAGWVGSECLDSRATPGSIDSLWWFYHC